MDVRKQLLERELKKLGFRKAGSGGSHDGASAQGQAPAGGSSHPQADAPADGHGE